MTSENKLPEFKSIGDAPQSIYTGVPGWMSHREQGVLAGLAQGLSYRTPNPTIVEIGSENGQSASIFTTFCPIANMICIDIDEDAPFEYNLALMDLYVDAIYGDSTRLKWIGVTKQLGYEVSDIDLLFIDGDHNHDAVQADLENFAPFIKSHGFLLLHDCACATNKLPHEQHYWVTSALNHWLAESGSGLGFRHLFSVDTLMVFRRF